MSKTSKTAGASPATRAAGIRLFGNLKVMAASALLCALSIVLGKYLAISTELFRISFENLPVLMAGVFFGPLVGGVVGAAADLVGCLMVGYTINPLITVGAASIGVVAGLISWYAFPRREGWHSTPLVYMPVMAAHTVGSMLIKSIGMAVYYSAPLSTLVWRIPLYLVIGGLEGLIILLLMKNKMFSGELNKLLSKKGGRR